jgi:hypothetical protein
MASRQWKRSAALLGMLVIMAAIGGLARAELGGNAVQPIAFSHKVHMEQQMDCATCHEHVERSPKATLPSNDICLGCHEDPRGKNPEEPKVRELAAQGPIPWVRVNRLPGHVYFSHRAHVTWGKLDCTQCHGNMAEATAPVTQSQIGHLTMSTCIGCHKERQVRTDCVTCHK